jgi:hypothetical protein
VFEYAISDLARPSRFDHSVDRLLTSVSLMITSTLTLGRKSTTYSAPR